MAKNRYSEVTTEQFDKHLAALVRENAATLLIVPGAFEVFSEFFNNDVLERCLDEIDERRKNENKRR